MPFSRAPRRLPLAPRPVPGERVFSWLSRTAASNGINVEELLRGFSAAYPEALGMIDSLDHDLPIAVRPALSQFCRVEPDSIRRLELSQQFPGLSRELSSQRICRACKFQGGLWPAAPAIRSASIVYTMPSAKRLPLRFGGGGVCSSR